MSRTFLPISAMACHKVPLDPREKQEPMKNRRVFQRTECSIPVVVHIGGRFLYGEVVDLSLGGARLSVTGEIHRDQLELTPNKPLPEGMAVIPLPYRVAWKEGGKKTAVGLQFAGGTNAFFRGWLADHLNPSMASNQSLLDHRQLVRVPCQMEGTLHTDQGATLCAILDLSAGGASLVVPHEVFPGETLCLSVPGQAALGELEMILLRVQALTNHYLCGGRFLEPSASQTTLLETLVEGLVGGPRAATIEA